MNYLDIPNDNTAINTRGHKLSGTGFSSTVDLYLTAKEHGMIKKKINDYYLMILLLILF